MRKIEVIKTVAADGHHMFTYENGKTPKPDDGVVFGYIGEDGKKLNFTEYPDRAGSTNGKILVTDEITQKNGNPCVDGREYTIYGAGEDYVFLTPNCSEKYHTKNIVTETSVTITAKSNPQKKADCELLRQLYMMLK